METFDCGYCGASQTVERSGGTVSLKLLTTAIRQVQTGTDKTAAELAIKRLTVEMQEIEQAIKNNRSNLFKTKSQIQQFYLFLWVFCCVLALFPAVLQGGLVGGFLFVIWLGGTVGLFYLWLKKRSNVSHKFEQIHGEIIQKGNEIHRLIQKNREIVDS